MKTPRKRPPAKAKVSMNLQLPPDEMKALDSLAAKESKSKVILVREALSMLHASRRVAA